MKESKEWWESLTITKQAVLKKQYFPHKTVISPNDIYIMYMGENNCCG